MNVNYYIELRKPSARGTESIAADVMRHLNTRQHLGKAVVVCEQPAVILSTSRKQWLRLSRSLQKQRSSTLNADKILKYTHTITRMQRMLFTTKNPLERPEGDVFFLSPDEAEVLAANCWTAYFLSTVDPKTILSMMTQLPDQALAVDYMQSPVWQELGFVEKRQLEKQVDKTWLAADLFLKKYGIDVTRLIIKGYLDTEAMDDALDIILGGHGHEFLEIANDFQRALELARPLRLKESTRYAYDSLVLLAHRVQALRPGAYSQQFLELYNENDTFFLYDTGRARKHHVGSETLEQVYARHAAAGRINLATHIQNLAKDQA